MARRPSVASDANEAWNKQATGPPLTIGVGASAGGLEAFKTLFSLMPADSGIAFVLVQHLDPTRPSLLVELLQNVTRMPVAQAEDGARIAADHVYVIPPDSTLTVEDDVLRVARPAPARETRRPIDSFFVSLAEAQGDNAVGVILSGGGSDGSAGVTAIKEHGGLTLAQAETGHQAKLGMPSSAAATGLVDDVLTVEQMPEKLLSYQRHLQTLRRRIGADGALSDAADSLAKICRIVRRVVGHDFSQYKDATLSRRIQRRMQVLHLDGMDAYIDRLRKEPAEAKLLFQEFLIGVTSFFRDPDAFEALDARAISQIVASKGSDDQIRVWVVGCATGEEAYSIAILLKERLNGRDDPPRLQIFATDIDERAIARARAARYRADELEGVTDARRQRWFVQDNDHWSPIKDIRELCVFSTHSAVKDPPFSKLDLVSCRNLLIYLQPAAQDRLIGVFEYALKPDGYLFLGASESVARHGKFFSVVDKKHRIFKRRPVTIAPLPNLMASAADKATPDGAAPEAAIALFSSVGPEDRLDLAARRVVERLFPAYVVVDARNAIVRFSGHVAKYLGPSPGAASLDLFSLLQRPLRPAAREVLQAATLSGRSADRKNVLMEIDGAPHRVDLVAEPVEGADGKRFCALAFVDRGPTSRPPAEPGADGVQDLERELTLTRERLQAAIDELETSNEEMKSANEEYQSVNEELQSTNEELETSKEEMQSINEELQTVNAELSAKHDALVRLNSDLKNFLDATEIAILFLDAHLRVTTFTPAMTDLFHLREGDYGRPITEIASRFEHGDLADDVARVLRTLSMIEHEVSTSPDRTYIMRIRPYRRIDNVIDGVVITFTDISDRKRLEIERRKRSEMVQSSSDAIVGLDRTGAITSWNVGAERLYGYSEAETIGKDAEMLIPSERRDEQQRALARIDQGEEIDHYETVRRRKDGALVPISLRVSPILDDTTGAVVGASEVARDIGERVRAEMALRESEERYRTLFEAIDEGFCVVEKVDTPPGAPSDFRYVAANPAFATQTGVADVTGKTVREAFPGEPEGWLDTYDAVITTGQPTRFEHAFVSKDRVLELYAVKVDDRPRVAVISADITERKRAEERQQLLIDEMNHRVKNTMATVQAIAAHTFAGDGDLETLRAAFERRLAALSRAHDTLSRNQWLGSPLRDVLRAEAAPYIDGDAQRIVIEGDDLDLTPSASLAIGMAFHELATNAAKYGGLSVPGGRVRVTWTVSDRNGAATLHLEWRESGGPPVMSPKRRGLGSRLIERGLAHQLAGKAELRFERTGVRLVLEAPLDTIAATR